MCVQSNKPQIEARLKPDLEAVSWPTFYLDFETVMTAIPLYFIPRLKRLLFINGLARLYPDFAADLNLLIGRLVDLEAIIKKNFYQPGFHGRTSIKRTLPVLVPEMSYDGLDIGDGFTAISILALMAFGKYEVDEAETLKKQLMVYCKQDTLAMVG